MYNNWIWTNEKKKNQDNFFQTLLFLFIPHKRGSSGLFCLFVFGGENHQPNKAVWNTQRQTEVAFYVFKNTFNFSCKETVVWFLPYIL